MGFKEDEASSSSHVLSIPREDTPLLGKNQHLSSPSKTFANVFIAIVGAGVLGLPYTFKRTGWVLGSLMLFIVAFLTYYCMMLLVYARRKLESHVKAAAISSFGDLGFAVCGPVGRMAVDVMIVLSQAGFCISYLIFVANTLAHLFNYSVANPDPKIFGISLKSVYIWGCFPFQLGLNSIPTLTLLAPLSIFADIVDLGAMGVVMVEELMIYLQNRPVIEMFGGFNVFIYGLGVAVYSFEGIGMVLPLESETRNKDQFGKILALAMALISLMFGAFGVVGYFAFGEDTKDIITTNLGGGLLSTFVQIGLCINLFISFPLMMNPVYEIMERRFCEGSYCLWLRWLAVLIVTFIALVVPNFADFLSLVGSSVCVCLGFVLPALFHWIVFKDELRWHGFALDGAFMVMGSCLAVYGTYSSLMEIFAKKA
ncbi:amino acid transporter AVT3B-like [Lycium ferocissimum]|uniref:amino acid transporter AVT3B-like n=1 Tax=Lycium ferocissimum TaxID=112874 RepID=UPI0028155137|nr:amino acid transporter AVT3B-like [Lycium ferocissimum]